MPFQPPPEIEECKLRLKHLLSTFSSLEIPRENFFTDIKNGSASSTSGAYLLEQYAALVTPLGETLELLKAFIIGLQDEMNVGVEKAKETSKEEEGKLRKHEWYLAREELVKELGDDLNDAVVLKTEVDHWVVDLKGNVQKLEGPGVKKEDAKHVVSKQEAGMPTATEQADQAPAKEPVVQAKEGSVDQGLLRELEMREWSSPQGTVEVISQAQPLQAQGYQKFQKSDIASRSNTCYSTPLSTPKHHGPRQSSMIDSNFMLTELHQQKATIKNFQASLECQTQDHSKYKKKYKEQKKLVKQLEEELRALKAEKDSKTWLNRGQDKANEKLQATLQEKLRAKIQANHEELLRAI